MAKHYVFKTHKSHKGLGYILLAVIAILIIGLLTQNWAKVSESVTDSPTQLTNLLLFIVIFQLIILIIMLAFFIVEVKDRFMQD